MFLWLAQNILVQQLNHVTTYLSSACQHRAEITQSHTCTALIRPSTKFNTSEISSNNSEKLSLLTDKHLLTFSYTCHSSSSQIRSHTVCIPAQTLFSHQKVLLGVKVHQQFCSHLIDLTPRSLFLRPKTYWSPQKSEQYRTFLSQPGSG